MPLRPRPHRVRALRCVDRVIAEESWEQKRLDVVKFAIDLFVMGDDWLGKFDFLSDLCEVRYLARTPDISSTDLKAEIRSGSGLADSVRSSFTHATACSRQ